MRALGLTLVVTLVLLPLRPVGAQTALSVDGVLESTAGGLRFPDGTTQSQAAASAPAPVEDTGIEGCWDDSGSSIPCSGTGQDGELQRGVAPATPRFTDNGDGTVTDNLTGLLWLRDANCFSASTWEDALANGNGLMSGDCGLTDGSVPTQWRLPNIKEMLSLVDYDHALPALPTGHPFDNVHSDPMLYWTSTSVASAPGFAFAMNMGGGAAVLPGKGGASHLTWPVRNVVGELRPE